MVTIPQENPEQLIITHLSELLKSDVPQLLPELTYNSQELGCFVDIIIVDHIRREKGLAISGSWVDQKIPFMSCTTLYMLISNRADYTHCVTPYANFFFYFLISSSCNGSSSSKAA